MLVQSTQEEIPTILGEKEGDLFQINLPLSWLLQQYLS